MLEDANYDIINCHSMNFLLAKHRIQVHCVGSWCDKGCRAESVQAAWIGRISGLRFSTG